MYSRVHTHTHGVGYLNQMSPNYEFVLKISVCESRYSNILHLMICFFALLFLCKSPLWFVLLFLALHTYP